MSRIYCLLANSQIYRLRPTINGAIYKSPKLRPCQTSRMIATSCSKFNETTGNSSGQSHDASRPSKPKQTDDIKYEVKFKPNTVDLKKLFKDMYSIYGPVFVACHIAVSLTSLGFFCSLVWMTVDPTQLMPQSMIEIVGEKMRNMSSEGGKFVLAYAIHKIILPVRIVGSIWLTRRISRTIKAWKAKQT